MYIQGLWDNYQSCNIYNGNTKGEERNRRNI